MSCRLHYAKKYEVEWKGGYFNWELDNVADIIIDAGGWVNDESGNSWTAEIDRDDLKDYINNVRYSGKEMPSINGYSTDEVLAILQDILENGDKNNNIIYLSFF